MKQEGCRNTVFKPDDRLLIVMTKTILTITAMKDKHDIIFDFNLDMICDFFRDLDRQGPGSREVTLRALSFITGLPDHPVMADIGCGTGGQTVTLAENTNGTITAIDFLPGMIEYLNNRIRNKGLEHKITGIVGSMFELPFSENELDLLWAEGSISNIGFGRGMREWGRYIRPGGYIAVTEATWFTLQRPEPIARYWNDNYPGIDTTSHKTAEMEEAGFMPVATFALEESCWRDNFYDPMPGLFEPFLERHGHSAAAQQFLERMREEIDYYERYSEYFGYTFYIGRKL